MPSTMTILNTCIACAVIAKMAPERGRRRLPWAILAGFIGVLSLIPLYLLPDRNKHGQAS